jgi:hypothetical protein
MPDGSELSGVPFGYADVCTGTVVVVVGGGLVVVVVGGGLVVVVVGPGVTVALGGGVVVVVGEGLLFDPLEPGFLWFDEAKVEPDGFELNAFACTLEVGVDDPLPAGDETNGVKLWFEVVIAVFTAIAVPTLPRLVVEADASMLTNAAKTLDATISVNTLETRCVVVPTMKCFSVPLLMYSKFAEQNHVATYALSTTTQIRFAGLNSNNASPIAASRATKTRDRPFVTSRRKLQFRVNQFEIQRFETVLTGPNASPILRPRN